MFGGCLWFSLSPDFDWETKRSSLAILAQALRRDALSIVHEVSVWLLLIFVVTDRSASFMYQSAASWWSSFAFWNSYTYSACRDSLSNAAGICFTQFSFPTWTGCVASLGCCWPWALGGIAVGWIAGTHYIRREQHLVNVRGRGGLAYEELPLQRGSSSWNPYYPYVDNLGVLAPTAPGAGSGPEGGSREKLRRVGDFTIPLSPQHSGSVRRRAVPRS